MQNFIISNEADYAQALALMDELMEDYDNQKPLIGLLSASITRWEDTSPRFKSFNDRIEKLNGGIATLRVIMEQHHLGVADLPEIGSWCTSSTAYWNTNRQSAAMCSPLPSVRQADTSTR